VDLQGIDNSDIIETIDAHPAPVLPVSACSDSRLEAPHRAGPPPKHAKAEARTSGPTTPKPPFEGHLEGDWVTCGQASRSAFTVAEGQAVGFGRSLVRAVAAQVSRPIVARTSRRPAELSRRGR
jgi:hypothetical protein